MPLGSAIKPFVWQTVYDNALALPATSPYDPGALADSIIHDLYLSGLLGSIRARMGYTGTPTGAPVAIFWGQYGDGTWRQLKTSAGSDEHTLSYNTTTDERAGTTFYADAIEVQTSGVVVIRTSLKTAATGATTAFIQLFPNIKFQVA